MGWKYYSNLAGRFEAVTPVYGSSGFMPIGEYIRHIRLAQGVKVTTGGWPGTAIWVPVRKVHAPTDNLVVSFCADNAGHPGTAIGSASMAGSLLTPGVQWVEFAMSASASLVAGTQYWIVLSRSSGFDDYNYYEVMINQDPGTDDSQFLTEWWGGDNWHSIPGQMDHRIRGISSMDNQVTAIIASSGQFLSGCRFTAISGQVSDPYRDGFRTGLTEVNDLLSAGDSSGSRLLVMVDSNRIAWIKAKPSAVELVGLCSQWLQELRGYELVGRWSRLAGVDLPPVGAPVVGGQDGFVERVTWVDGVMGAGFSY